MTVSGFVHKHSPLGEPANISVVRSLGTVDQAVRETGRSIQQQLVDINPLEVTDMSELDPVLREPVMADEH